jgi:Mn2+/Fe2+ NRAMP family transporter
LSSSAWRLLCLKYLSIGGTVFVDLFRRRGFSRAVPFIPVCATYSSMRLLNIRSAVGIVGATVMPHSLFLGSHLATQDRLANDSKRDLPPFSDTSMLHQMTSLQRILRSIRYTFNWRRLFYISHSDETSYPPNVRTHADRENNKLSFVRSHMYHGMADVITSLMGFAVIINSL